MITLGDAEALSAVFGEQAKRHEDSFVNSLAYYLLTGRHSAKIYTNGRNFIVTCAHPHEPGTTLIFPEIGDGPSMSADLMLYLQGDKGNFQLARYTDLDLHKAKAALSLHGNRQIATYEPMTETHMDWVYPVRILDTYKTASMQGKHYESVRNKFNKVRDHVEIERLEPHGNLKNMRACLHFWLGSLEAAGIADAESRSAFYKTLIEDIAAYPTLFDGFVVQGKDEPIGFTIWDKKLENTANSLASISRHSVKGLSEFQIVSACKILDSEGVGYLNLGGSEQASLDHHKLKFNPAKSVEIASYRVNFMEAGLTCPT